MMLRLMAFLVVGCLIGPAATLTPNERSRAMSELHASRKMLIDATSGLSAAQLNWKAGPERWSIAEVAEHLALAEDFLFGMYKQTASTAADPEKHAAMKDEEVLGSIRNREQKAKAPEPAVPKKTFADTAAAVAAFKEKRDRTIAYVETTQDADLRQKVMPSMGMDAYQMFLMMAAHTERHCDQIAEVKATAGYPR